MRVFSLICVLFLSSCGDQTKAPSHVLYQASIDVTMVSAIEAEITTIGKRWNLTLFQKNKDQMQYLTQDKEALYMSLHFNKNAVLIIDNVGVGEILSVMAIDYDEMKKENLEKLTNDVISTLETKLQLNFQKGK